MASTIYQPQSVSRTWPHCAKSAKPSHSGIWVAIFAITMSFMAFTSALMVRQGSGNDWTHVVLPPILYLNTLALVCSSLTLELSRRASSISSLGGSPAPRSSTIWLSATLALGLLFIAGQYEAWRQLVSRGLYLATSPNSSFFYVFTGLHAIHVLGGIAALAYLTFWMVVRPQTLRRSTFGSTATYWHFMGTLWIYLLCVLRTRL
jgi:cytochrome c oxidase subunit III